MNPNPTIPSQLRKKIFLKNDGFQLSYDGGIVVSLKLIKRTI